MKDFEANVSIVLDTLVKYQYAESSLAQSRRCFSKLGAALGVGTDAPFSVEDARAWCANTAPESLKPFFTGSITRLDDVYRYGRVLWSHLPLKPHLSPTYAGNIDLYLSSLPTDSPDTLRDRIKWNCANFCFFIQCNDVATLDELDYPSIEQYTLYLDESGRADRAGDVSKFLDYYFRQGLGRRGYAMYLDFFNRVELFSLSSLSEEARTSMEALREESLGFPLEDLYAALPDYLERMRQTRYADLTIARTRSFLERLYLFLDIGGFGYNYKVADLLLQDQGTVLFGSTGVNVMRHILAAFEFYTQEGEVAGYFIMSQPGRFTTLPEWCQKGLCLFVESLRKRKLSEGSIVTISGCATGFCQFLVSDGSVSFETVTPDVIKRFNLQDQHGTVSAKNRCNSNIRQFIKCMELHGMMQLGINNALPKCASGHVNIVEVLSDEQRRCIYTYCNTATTPLQIRDAAVLLIGMSTGLRPIDILGLRTGNICHREGLIRFTQQKTGVPHVAVLEERVWNAIVRYCRDVRPKDTGDDHIFLTLKAPYRPLHSHDCQKALLRTGVHAEFRILRRTFATDQIKNGASVDDAAKFLGHSNSNTVHRYVALDSERMQDCTLSLEDTGLAMPNGRFSDE